MRALTFHATEAKAQTNPRTSADAPRLGSLDPEGPQDVGSAREVAASCMSDLPNMQPNASEFLQALRADSFEVNFNWVDRDAWYKDWMDDRAKWADAADMLYYEGHANDNGWQLAIPGTANYLMCPDVVASPNTYGAEDLEWIAISACGPLQDDWVYSGGGDALDRWWRAFGGLHVLLGYGTASTDVPCGGKLFAQYLLEGKTIVNAWFRMAAETQPPDNGHSPPNGPQTRAGAMWAEKSGRKPVYDHLWGHGLVARDPFPPTSWHVMWSPP